MNGHFPYFKIDNPEREVWRGGDYIIRRYFYKLVDNVYKPAKKLYKITYTHESQHLPPWNVEYDTLDQCIRTCERHRKERIIEQKKMEKQRFEDLMMKKRKVEEKHEVKTYIWPTFPE